MYPLLFSLCYTDISSPDVTVDGALLSDADTVYTFTVTAENFLGESDTSSLSATRSGVATPEVTIVSKGVDTSNAFVSERYSFIDSPFSNDKISWQQFWQHL